MDDYKKDLIADIDKKISDASSLLSDPQLKEMAQNEIEELENQKNQILGNYKTTKQDSSDGNSLEDKNILLQVSGAAGGDEAKNWAEELLRMYSRYSELVGYKIDNVDDGVIRISGKINGISAFNNFKYEAGVHRVQRIPTTEKRGRVHTSTAAVSILPELDDIDLHIRPEEIEFEAFRSGGHGGQNVNKVSTAVRIKHTPTGIVVTAQTERHQAQNREIAMNLLRAKLWEIEQEKQQNQITSLKSTQVGRGMRSEKIRTFNFPQDRLTDHRFSKSWHNLPQILDGEGLSSVIEQTSKYLSDSDDSIDSQTVEQKRK